MVVQDPIMSFLTLIVSPPALLMMRKLIRRIYVDRDHQFHGGTRILETLQETVQGIPTVKAFTLEDAHAARGSTPMSRSSNTSSNKWARVGGRASPLMEALGGIRDRLRHDLWRLPGHPRPAQTPGSSSRSWPRSCSPMSRPSGWPGSTSSSIRGLVGVRILFEIIDSPPTEPNDDDKPALN